MFEVRRGCLHVHGTRLPAATRLVYRDSYLQQAVVRLYRIGREGGSDSRKSLALQRARADHADQGLSAQTNEALRRLLGNDRAAVRTAFTHATSSRPLPAEGADRGWRSR